MIYELRFYHVAPGRMPDVHDRFRSHLPALLNRHGIDPIGLWTVRAGGGMPMFVYMVAFEDLAARERAWAGFYSDRDWPRIRSATNAGSEMVERYTLMFLRPNAALTDRAADLLAKQETVHELLMQQVAIGQTREIESYLRETYLPAIERAGGRAVLVADVLSGVNLPQLVIMTEWPNSASREAGRVAIDNDAAVSSSIRSQRASLGYPLFAQADAFLLDPLR